MKKRLHAMVSVIAFVALLVGCGKETGTWQNQFDLGVKYVSEGNYKEAIAAFNASIRIDKKNQQAYLELAKAYVSIGEIDSAESTLDKGMKDATETEALEEYNQIIQDAVSKGTMPPVNYSGTMLTDDRWVIEPQYSFDRMIPLYSCESDTCGYGTSKSIYAVQQDGAWSLFNSESRAIYLSDISSAMPFLYGDLELYLDIDVGNDYQTIIETQNRINGELRQNGARFIAWLEAHEGYSFAWSQLPVDGKIYRTRMSVGPADNTPIDQIQSMNLIGVRQAEESGDFPGSYGPIPYSSYAVGNAKGELLTEYSYDNVCMAGEALIACQNDEGLWGYVNQSGTEIVPCEYLATFDYSLWNTQHELPYPDMSGLVLVKNQAGEMLALDLTGQIVIRPGKYEDMSPARDGCIWVKQNGLWGLLQIDSVYTVERRGIFLPEEAVQPDMVVDASECLSTVTLAEHGLSLRMGPSTDYEKIDSIPYYTKVWICGYSSDNPDWAVIQYGSSFGWVSTEYLM